MKSIETKSLVLLKHHLKQLRLPSIHDECENRVHVIESVVAVIARVAPSVGNARRP